MGMMKKCLIYAPNGPELPVPRSVWDVPRRLGALNSHSTTTRRQSRAKHFGSPNTVEGSDFESADRSCRLFSIRRRHEEIVSPAGTHESEFRPICPYALPGLRALQQLLETLLQH